MKKLLCIFVLLFFLSAVASVCAGNYVLKPINLTFEDDILSFSYYHSSCPNVEKIIHDKVKQWVAKDYTLAPALLRLHFHDCAVRVSLHFLSLSLYIYVYYVKLINRFLMELIIICRDVMDQFF